MFLTEEKEYHSVCFYLIDNTNDPFVLIFCFKNDFVFRLFI